PTRQQAAIAHFDLLPGRSTSVRELRRHRNLEYVRAAAGCQICRPRLTSLAEEGWRACRTRSKRRVLRSLASPAGGSARCLGRARAGTQQSARLSLSRGIHVAIDAAIARRYRLLDRRGPRRHTRTSRGSLDEDARGL